MAVAMPSGHQYVPWAGLVSMRASSPSSARRATSHSAASRSPGDALGR
jgi:hypothetical protein